MYNRNFTAGRITRLAENEIFVFGSNLEGYHGGGAAWIAMEKFGCGILDLLTKRLLRYSGMPLTSRTSFSRKSL